KRLGQFLGPIVLVNTAGYYDRLLDFMAHSVSEHFMNRAHLDMWQTVEQPEDAVKAMREALAWSARDALEFAAVRSST
ncbi:MAG TPA: LOG family protein, partial [Wenzhouxiangella sp.]|nr:LOG family protein [Wenzhouxiangella sp.]